MYFLKAMSLKRFIDIKLAKVERRLALCESPFLLMLETIRGLLLVRSLFHIDIYFVSTNMVAVVKSGGKW